MAFINRPRVILDEGFQTDAFGRLRVSNPDTLFGSKLLFDKRPYEWDEVTEGSATSTHVSIHAAVTMSVTSSGDRAVRQTFQSMNYQPGKSQLILATGILSTEADVTKELGYARVGTSSPYNIQNGSVFGNDGVGAYVAVYKNGTRTERAYQSDWNIDPMDGTGPSQKTVNWNKIQIFVIDLQWLGAGRVRFAIDIDGEIFPVHEFFHSNINTSVYMSTPNLPLLYRIESNGGAGSLTQVCSSVEAEGGFDHVGSLRAVDRRGSNSGQIFENLSNDTITALLGIRIKSAYTGAVVNPVSLSVQTPNSGNFHWRLTYNPTINNSGGFTWNSLTNSSVEFMNTTTNSESVSNEGIVIASGYVSSNQDAINVNLDNDRYLGMGIDGTPDELWMTIESDESGDEFFAAITFREIY